jgi:hypothetical protein
MMKMKAISYKFLIYSLIAVVLFITTSNIISPGVDGVTYATNAIY